jgi:hypothetical protein
MKKATVKSLLAVWLIAGAPALAFAQMPRPVAPAAPAAPVAPPTPATRPVAQPAAPAIAAPAPHPAATAAPVTKPAVAAPAPAPATAAAAPVAAAPVAAAPVAPKPPAELDQMKVLEGTWRCDGRAPAGPGGPEHAYKSTWKFKRDLDNFWWAAEYQQLKAKNNPAPMKARGYMTYDPGSKGFVMLGVDNMGGTSSETTPGWTGDSVTLAGDASQGGRKIPFREVITKNGEREFTWRGEMKVGSDWVTLGEDRCKK